MYILHLKCILRFILGLQNGCLKTVLTPIGRADVIGDLMPVISHAISTVLTAVLMLVAVSFLAASR